MQPGPLLDPKLIEDNLVILNVLFEKPFLRLTLRGLTKKANDKKIDDEKKFHISPNGLKSKIRALKKAGIVDDIEHKHDWAIWLTRTGFVEYRKFYARSKSSTGKDSDFIKKLLERGAELITSSPRNITLLGEYAIADSTLDLPSRALGMAINSRTYLGFKRRRSEDDLQVCELFYFRNQKWTRDRWEDTGLPDLNEYCNLVYKWWRGLHPSTVDDRPPDPSVTVVTDSPGNLGLNLAASTMPAFAVGYALILQSDGMNPRNRISTCFGELSLDEKELIRKIAIDCERLYRKHTGAKLCSGMHSLIATYGGIVCAENNRSKSNGGWNDDLKPTQLKSPEKFPILILEQAGHQPSSQAINQVLKCKNAFSKIDKANLVFENVYKTMNYLSKLGSECIQNFDANKLGKLMKVQHDLLRLIEASDPLVDSLVLKILEGEIDGLCGVKITGPGGKGSALLVLYDETYSGEELEATLRKKFPEIKSVIANGVVAERGVTIEIPSAELMGQSEGPIIRMEDSSRLDDGGKKLG